MPVFLPPALSLTCCLCVSLPACHWILSCRSFFELLFFSSSSPSVLFKAASNSGGTGWGRVGHRHLSALCSYLGLSAYGRGMLCTQQVFSKGNIWISDKLCRPYANGKQWFTAGSDLTGFSYGHQVQSNVSRDKAPLISSPCMKHWTAVKLL